MPTVGESGSTSAYAADSAPPGLNAAAMSSYRTLSDIGYMIGPILLGWLGDARGLDAPLWTATAALPITTILFAAIAPETHRNR